MKRILGILLCLCLLLSGCSGAAKEEEEERSDAGDIISDALTPEKEDDLSTFGLAYQSEFGLNPYDCTSLSNRTILSLLYESLFTVTSTFDVEPVLCDYYDVSDNLQNYTIHLLPDVKFSDGTPLTAKDVKASYNAAINSDVYGSRFYALNSIEIVDDATVIFHTTQPYENFTLLLDVPIVQASTSHEDAPLGTGPFRLVAERHTSTLVRNSYWWRDPYDAAVTVRSIHLVPTSTPTDVRDDFEYGITGVVCTDPNSAAYVDYHCDYELWNCSTTIMEYIGFNARSGLFCLSDLRIAFTHILDRNAIATELYRGYGEAAVLPASPLSPFYDAELAKKYDYAPDKFVSAVALTKAKTSQATFLVCNTDPRRVEAAEYIAAEAAKYGIELVVDAVNEKTYKNRLYNGDFELFLGEARLSPTFDLTSFFNGGALCYGHIDSNELTKLSKAALENSGNYYNLHDAIMSNGLICPVLFKSYAVYASRGTISNMYPAVDNVFHTSNGRTLSEAMIDASANQPTEEAPEDGEETDSDTEADPDEEPTEEAPSSDPDDAAEPAGR